MGCANDASAFDGVTPANSTASSGTSSAVSVSGRAWVIHKAPASAKIASAARSAGSSGANSATAMESVTQAAMRHGDEVNVTRSP